MCVSAVCFSCYTPATFSSATRNQVAPAPTIVRVVVNGRPWKKPGRVNFDKANGMLKQALRSRRWPATPPLFVITPGGFIQARMPKEYDGMQGWNCRRQDFQHLIPAAEQAVDKVATAEIKQELGLRSQFLTLGVDLVLPGQVKGSRGIDTHAELVAIIELSTGRIRRWTGKSYPTVIQEDALVHETTLNSHCFRCKDQRTLILGCHDLNIFNNRSRATGKNPLRVKRWRKLDQLACQFKPTLVLHHPHETDTWETWQGGWSGARQHLDSMRTYASGIAYFSWDHKSNRPLEPRRSLDSVLQRTKCGDVVDICVNGY